MLYNLGEVNSVSVIEEAKAYCDANNLKYVEANVTNSARSSRRRRRSPANARRSTPPSITPSPPRCPRWPRSPRPPRIPVYVGADSMVIDGGLATIGVNYVQLGNQTAAHGR